MGYKSPELRKAELEYLDGAVSELMARVTPKFEALKGEPKETTEKRRLAVKEMLAYFIEHGDSTVNKTDQFKARVKDELAALDEKITSLAAFKASPGYHQLPVAERKRLNQQWLVMNMYSGILQDRLDADFK